jgi:hypothetical protein
VYIFEVTPDDQVTDYPAGFAAELGLYEDLPPLITDPTAKIEYGIVEYRYGTAHPKEYRRLLDTYGHTSMAPRRYTTSSFIGGVLGRLFAYGDLDGDFGPATGYWSYNSIISYLWPTSATPDRRLTWKEFAVDQGLDPLEWPLTK